MADENKNAIAQRPKLDAYLAFAFMACAALAMGLVTSSVALGVFFATGFLASYLLHAFFITDRLAAPYRNQSHANAVIHDKEAVIRVANQGSSRGIWGR